MMYLPLLYSIGIVAGEKTGLSSKIAADAVLVGNEIGKVGIFCRKRCLFKSKLLLQNGLLVLVIRHPGLQITRLSRNSAVNSIGQAG